MPNSCPSSCHESRWSDEYRNRIQHARPSFRALREKSRGGHAWRQHHMQQLFARDFLARQPEPALSLPKGAGMTTAEKFRY